MAGDFREITKLQFYSRRQKTTTMADAGGFAAAQEDQQEAAPKRGGARGGKKRKSSGKDADDKKGRKARVSRVPAAPPSIDITTTHAALGDCTVARIAALISATDPEHVSRALNALLKASADTDANYCLGVGGEKVIDALCQLFDETIGWDDSIHEAETIDFKTLEPNVSHWGEESLIGKHKRWRELCRSKLASPMAPSSDASRLIDHETEVPVLEIVLAIFRNLSYVAQNLRFLLYSDNALRVLTGALYYRGFSFNQKGGDNHSVSHNSNMCVYAIETLINMAPLVDITGRQLFIDRVFLESDEKEITSTVPYQTSAAEGDDNNSSSYGIASRLGFGGMHLAKQYDTRAETVDSISDEVVWSMVSSHVQATLAIFPALAAVLDPNDTTTVTTSGAGWHRPSLQFMLELLVALIENKDNRGIFTAVPDFMLHQLTEMLYIHRLGPESLDYIDPVNHPVVRVLPVKLSMGYDVTVDTDIRDRACELLVKLTELSPNARRRLGMATSISGMARKEYGAPVSDTTDGLSHSILQSGSTSSPARINVRLFDSITSMISTASGRGDAASLASQLLSNMATVPENKVGILYCERKLISVSSMSADVANVACNGIFNRI